MSLATAKNRRLCWLGALAGAALPLAAHAEDPASTPGAFELLERVRNAYADFESYHDLGEIETSDGPPGGERTTLRFFETAADADGSFLWRSHGETADGFEERVIWNGDAGSFVYSSLYGQYKPVSSLTAELAHILGHGSYEALLVPLLLAGADDVLADPPAAALDGVEPCGQETCWVISLIRMAGAIECRLWVDQRSSMIREVLVTLDRVSREPSSTAAGKPLTLRVRHQPSPEAPPTFRPPAEARRVVAWQPPAAEGDLVEPADGAGGSVAGPAFGDEITVSLLSVVARIIDSRGEPIRGLEAGDLIARVGGTDVPVLDLEWQSSPQTRDEKPAVERATARGGGRAGTATIGAGAPARTGKLVVLFLQVDLEPTRIAGHLKILPEVEKLLDGLPPDDRVAIVSFDSHLKLWLDFNRDRERTFDVLERAIGYGTPAARRARGVSLRDHFDRRAAASAATPEVGLRLIAEALTPLPGEKDLLYLGWGLGRYGAGGVRMTADYEPAIRALGAARTTVFVLDVSQADFHSLEVGLQGVAASTGGTYDRTLHFASQAVRRLARTLRGHYLVTIDQAAMPGTRGRLTLRLRHRRGQVLYRPMIFD